MINPTFKRYPLGSSAVHILATVVSSTVGRSQRGSRTRKVAGSIGAVVGAVFKTVPGAIQGLVQGARFNLAEATHSQGSSTGLYTVTTVAETMMVGAGVGSVAGPLGMAVGTGAGFLVGVVGRVAESKARMARDFVRRVDHRVDTYLTFNGDASQTAIHNAMQGTKVGAQAGWRQGLSQGRDAGCGLLDATEHGLNILKNALFGR